MTTSIHYPLVRTSHSSYLDVREMNLSSVPKRGSQSLGISKKAKIVFLFPDFPLQLLNVLRSLYLKAHSVLGIEVTLLKWSTYVLIFNFKFLVSDLKTTQNKIKIISNPITSWNQDFQGKNQ